MAFLKPFIYINDLFTKTGSGQIWGMHSKTDRFLSGLRALASLELRSREAVSGAENALFEPLLYKMHHFAKTGSGQR